MITVILNAYKRGQHLAKQLNAIKDQSLKPTEIMLWQNHAQRLNPQLTAQTVWSSCNQNLGVCARWAYALNAKTEYICIMDDDAIPGNQWLQNCYETMQVQEGVLGTCGVIFKDAVNYNPNDRVGWSNPNEASQLVDLVGQGWFLKKEWLHAFWKESPMPNAIGDDLHLTYMFQKYLGVPSYVPPHPPSNKELWGSLPETGWAIGQDSAAVSMNPANHVKMQNEYEYYIRNGFKIINS